MDKNPLNNWDFDGIEEISSRFLWKSKKGVDVTQAIGSFSKETKVDCLMMMYMAYWTTLLEIMGDEAFKEAYDTIVVGASGRVVLTKDEQSGQPQAVRVDGDDDIIGDNVYFDNDDAIVKMSPRTPWTGDNTIKTGKDEYTGEPGGTKSAKGWKSALETEYKKAIKAAKGTKNEKYIKKFKEVEKKIRRFVILGGRIEEDK